MDVSVGGGDAGGVGVGAFVECDESVGRLYEHGAIAAGRDVVFDHDICVGRQGDIAGAADDVFIRLNVSASPFCGNQNVAVAIGPDGRVVVAAVGCSATVNKRDVTVGGSQHDVAVSRCDDVALQGILDCRRERIELSSVGVDFHFADTQGVRFQNVDSAASGSSRQSRNRRADRVGGGSRFANFNRRIDAKAFRGDVDRGVVGISVMDETGDAGHGHVRCGIDATDRDVAIGPSVNVSVNRFECACLCHRHISSDGFGNDAARAAGGNR